MVRLVKYRGPAAQAFGLADLILFVLPVVLVFSIAFVAASPLDLKLGNGDDAPGLDLFARAASNHTGKYVGSLCKTNEECYSKNCVSSYEIGSNVDGKNKSRCQRQPNGGPCFKNANCQSRNCELSKGTCTGPSLLLGACNFNDRPCSSTANGGLLDCDGQYCRLLQTAPCKKDNECRSNMCNSQTKKCGTQGLPPDARCFTDGDCLSGECALCQNTHAGLDCNSNENYLQTFCQRYPIGHMCSTSNECFEGLCSDGKCVNSKVGDACTNKYQCNVDGQICGADNKCRIPSTATLKPKERCDTDDQCISQKCTDYIYSRNDYGINEYEYPSSFLLCDYLQNGQGPCSSTADCLYGVCKEGVCQGALDGEACDVNYRCVNTCGTDGICYTPPLDNSLPALSPCKDDASCLSNVCTGIYKIGRLSLEGREPIEEYDSSCGRLSLGNACYATSDCRNGLTCDTTQRKCVAKQVGESCETYTECQSRACVNRTCGLNTAFVPCSSNSQCFSNECTTQNDCYFGCPEGNSCSSIPAGDQCRIDEDCNYPLQYCLNGTCG